MNKKTIALVAHDNRKQDLLEWVEWNKKILNGHQLICTGTTGRLIQRLLDQWNETGKKTKVRTLKSGPLGGDQQLGALISEGKIDIFVFLWDPMEPQPHDVDVKALLRISALYNIPTACNRSTADFIISSSLFTREYVPMRKDYGGYLRREINIPHEIHIDGHLTKL